MANSIAYISAYLKKLDEVFKATSKTTVLDAKPGAIKPDEMNANSIYISTLALTGLGTYSRSTGYPSGGAVTIAWNQHTFSQERGQLFKVDTQDLREALMDIAKIGTEFERVCVAPEIDAYRFDAIEDVCSIDTNADLDYDNTIAAIDEGIKTLDDAEVPEENRLLFVSNAVYKNMKESGEFTYVRVVDNVGGRTISREIEQYDGMRVIKVPSARFYSDFTFSATDGFSATSGGYALNFVIAHEPSILGVKKHVKPKIIPPEYVSDGDFYVFGYRIYHDLFVPTNKLSAVYIHAVATAVT